MKKTKYTIIIFLSFFLFVSQINCAEYTIVESSDVDRTITGSNSEKPGYGGAYKITLQDTTDSDKKITAYCTDPYVEGEIDKGTKYVESNINAQDAAAYQSIFNQTCGDEKMQTAAIKTYIATSGREYMGNNATTQAVYAGVMKDGSTAYLNDESATKDLQGIVGNAQKAANNAKETSSAGLKINNMGDTVTITGEKGSFSVNGGGAQCTETTSGNKTTYKCTIKSICDNALNPDSISEDIAITSNDGGAGTPTSSKCQACTPKMYTISSGKGGQVQRFVACVDEGTGYSRNNDGKLHDEAGGTPAGSGTTEIEELTCDDSYTFDDDCSVPCETFTDSFNDDEGSEICDDSGNTIVEVKENAYSNTYEDTFCCIKDGKDELGNDSVVATKTILGFEDDPNNHLCQAYCTDKSYTLELPGPTSDRLDKEVLVNAGTFFNIEGKMESKSEIECYVTADYKALVTSVNSLRTTMANTVTKLNEYKAYKDTVSSYLNHRDTNCNYEDVPYPCCSSGYTLNEGKCIKEKVQDDGTTTTDIKSASECIKRECTSTYYTYYGTYTIPSYKAVYFDPTGENGGSYSVNTVPSSNRTCALSEDEYNNNKFCEDNLKLRDNIDDKISEAQKEVEKAQKNLDPNNTSGILNGYLKEWDYCLGGGAYQPKGWSFDIFNGKVQNIEKNCYTKVEFTYEDGEYLGIKPAIKPSKIETNPSVVNKNGTETNKNLKVGTCTKEGSCNENTTNVPYTDGFTYATNTITTTYHFENKFCSPYNESDSVYYLTSSESESDCNGVVLEGFPIALETPQGEYSYRYSYSGIGYYYDTGGDKCVGRLEDIIGAPNTAYDNTCMYNVNNCRACDVICKRKGPAPEYEPCDLTFADCDRKCKISCVGGGCLLDINAGFLATYRTISLNNPFPNEFAYLNNKQNPLLLAAITPSSTREFPSSNWNTDKGNMVKGSITSDGDSIYNKKPEYAITLDPGTIKQIRDYNKANPNYFDKSKLTCDKHAYANYLTCESEFVDTYGFETNNRTWEYYNRDYEKEKFTGPALK